MSNVVHDLFDRAGNWVNAGQRNVDKAFGWDTSNTALSQILDPGRKLRINQEKGAGTGPADVFDPNAKFHSLSTNTDDEQATAGYERKLALEAATPHAPSQDNAANAAQQQSDYLRKRRGILGNIFGGQQPNSTPVVSQKSLLGT